MFIGRTDADAEAESPIAWSPDAKSRLTGKDPDAGKDRRQEKGMTENDLTLHIRWPKYWNFSFSKSPSNEISGLISL